MLKNLLKIVFIFTTYSHGSEDQYLGMLKDINQKFCTSLDMKNYYSLNNYVVSQKIYIPMIEMKVDKETIKSHIPLIESKIEWTKSVLAKLEGRTGVLDISNEVIGIKKAIQENLLAKFKYEVDGNKSRDVINDAKKSISELKKNYESILSKAFYLKNFHFPIDHTRNRIVFERIKDSKDKASANRLFFKRKIYEDGAPFSRSRSDKHVRMVIDNLSSEMARFKIFTTERVLSDLNWLLRVFKKDRKLLNISQYKNYFQQWGSDLIEKRDQYKILLSQENVNQDYIVKKYKERNFANFVYFKEGEVYKYLSEKSEELQKKYVLDTILYNEVGGLDPNNTYKKDIIETVLNRMNHSGFNQLRDDAPIHQYLKNFKVNKSSKWLNILFNKGEFSFTYHYFKAAKHIFCPPMTRIGKRLRAKNLDFISSYFEVKKKQNKSGPYYYFSRVSMPGRVDMSKVWTHAKAIVKKLGKEVVDKKSVIERIKKNKYIYSFVEDSKKYLAFNLNDKLYAIDKFDKPGEVYELKDEELFKFFSLK